MAIGAALQGAGMAVQVLGALRQNEIDKQVFKFNARQANQRADLLEILADEDNDLRRRQQAQRRGSQLAQMASQGVRIDGGQALSNLYTQLEMDEFNNSRALFQADEEAHQIRLNAKLGKIAMKERQVQNIIGAVGGGLSGAAGIAGGF